MSNTYVLVNPHIEGDVKNRIKADNSVEAGKKIYKNLSEHFNNAIPQFYFTIQKGGSGTGKFYHFKVSEKIKNDNVSFTLEPYTIVGGDNMSSFSDKLSNIKNKLEMSGGKKTKKAQSKSKSKSKPKDSSDSDSSSDMSSSDEYKYINTYVPVASQPISYYWYDPSVYKLDTYYIPTFYAYTTPVIMLNFA